MRRVTHCRNPRRRAALVAMILAATLPALPAFAAEAVPKNSSPGTIQLVRSAEQGQFQQVLSQLQGEQPQGSEVGGLVQAIQRYQKQASQRATLRQQKYQQDLAKVAKALAEGKLETALAAAINARAMSDQPQTVLQDKQVAKLVKQAAAGAQQAEQGQNWLRALDLYRLLDMLYDDYATYHPAVKEASQHVRVLQLYAPKKLEALYKQEAKRTADEDAADQANAKAGKDQPATQPADEAKAKTERFNFALTSENWKARLKDVDLTMLKQTIAQEGERHVDDKGFVPLMRGAIDELLVLVRTPALGDTFPTLKDAKTLGQFEHYLNRVSATLQTPGEKLSYLDASTIIDRVLVMNDQTVNLPEKVLVYEMAQGATGTLDPFSDVIWPNDKAQFTRNTDGKFTGVGIQLSRRDGRLLVLTPLPNTPAQKAGIQAGDIIAEVDGQSTDNWSLEKAVHQITGEEGSKVILGISRKGHAGVMDFSLKRAEIPIESVRGWEHAKDGEWDYFIDRKARIGYVRLSQFIPQTADDLDAAVAQMQKTGPIRGLILDLRYNPGGLLSSAIDVVNRFIDRGPIVFTVDKNRKHTWEADADGLHTYPYFPVVILINQGSASAAEIVTGALQDYQRATIVGTRSFGKGSVQDLFYLDHAKAMLKLTTNYYMLPKGRIIHRRPDATQWGIDPDIDVKMTAKEEANAIELRQKLDVIQQAVASDGPVPGTPGTPGNAGPTATNAKELLTKGIDPQLDAALLVLRTRLVAGDIALAKANGATSAVSRATP